MSLVDFKIMPCHPVEFKGQGAIAPGVGLGRSFLGPFFMEGVPQIVFLVFTTSDTWFSEDIPTVTLQESTSLDFIS